MYMHLGNIAKMIKSEILYLLEPKQISQIVRSSGSQEHLQSHL